MVMMIVIALSEFFHVDYAVQISRETCSDKANNAHIAKVHAYV